MKMTNWLNQLIFILFLGICSTVMTTTQRVGQKCPNDSRRGRKIKIDFDQISPKSWRPNNRSFSRSTNPNSWPRWTRSRSRMKHRLRPHLHHPLWVWRSYSDPTWPDRRRHEAANPDHPEISEAFLEDFRAWLCSISRRNMILGNLTQPFKFLLQFYFQQYSLRAGALV